MMDACGNEVCAHISGCKDTKSYLIVQEFTFRCDVRVIEFWFGCYGDWLPGNSNHFTCSRALVDFACFNGWEDCVAVQADPVATL